MTMNGVRRSDRKRKAGYNLVELMVAMAVIAILLAVAVPNFASKNARSRVEGAARDLSSRIQQTRHKSLAKRTPYRLVIDRSTPSYYFEKQEDDSTWVKDPDEVYEVKGIYSTLTEIGGSPTEEEIYFESRGTIHTDYAPAIVKFTSPSADTASLSLVRTGRVTVRMSH